MTLGQCDNKHSHWACPSSISAWSLAALAISARFKGPVLQGKYYQQPTTIYCVNIRIRHNIMCNSTENKILAGFQARSWCRSTHGFGVLDSNHLARSAQMAIGQRNLWIRLAGLPHHPWRTTRIECKDDDEVVKHVDTYNVIYFQINRFMEDHGGVNQVREGIECYYHVNSLITFPDFNCKSYWISIYNFSLFFIFIPCVPLNKQIILVSEW